MEEQTSKVSGVVQIDGTPAQRTVRAFGYEAQTHAIDGNEVTLSRTLGHATSDPATGEYTIDLLAGYADPIFVVAFDDYGADFTPDMALTVGDRVHPTTPNGHVFECTGAGTLPSEEPTWVVDTETAQLYGTASMIAKPFYRPMVHGPVAPEVTGVVEPIWTPANLFSNNEVGAWYDPSDLTTLFQDATVNQPVQNDGDPVGLMLDKSGNGLIAFQEDAAKRPIFRTNGSESWLEFSGGQKLKTEVIGLGPNWVAAAGYSTTVNAFQSIIDGDDSKLSSTRVGQFIRINSNGKAETIGFNASATAFPVTGASSITSGQAVTHISKMENGTLTLFQDGVSEGSIPISGTPASATIPIGIGARNAQDSQFFDGKLFSLVLLAQSSITAGNQRELEAYISKATGAT